MMIRCVRHLGSTWCRWHKMSLLAAANQQFACVGARQRCPAISGVVGADRNQSSPVYLVQRASRLYCYEASATRSGSPDDDDNGNDRGADVEATLVSDGPRGLPVSSEENESNLDDKDIGKTRIPPESTDTLVFGGIPYYELPIIHIKATYNNTHINITDHTGRKSYTRTTCGAEGFKNAKKGTSIAAQTVGISAATKALDKGLKTVRVMVKGIGPGRQASIKGLQMGGLDIVSITDNTPVPHNGNRPRKARRL